MSAPSRKTSGVRLPCRPMLVLTGVAIAAALACQRPAQPPGDGPPAPAQIPAQALLPAQASLPAEDPREVTLTEYAKMCAGENATGCERACDRGDAASCTSLGWLYDHPRGRI